MHDNRALLTQLYTALGHHDHATMAACYHRDATFRDIAFDLKERAEIHTMWHMICSGDIKVEFELLDADDHSGRVDLIDTYTLADRSRTRSVRGSADARCATRSAPNSRSRMA